MCDIERHGPYMVRVDPEAAGSADASPLARCDLRLDLAGLVCGTVLEPRMAPRRSTARDEMIVRRHFRHRLTPAERRCDDGDRNYPIWLVLSRANVRRHRQDPWCGGRADDPGLVQEQECGAARSYRGRRRRRGAEVGRARLRRPKWGGFGFAGGQRRSRRGPRPAPPLRRRACASPHFISTSSSAMLGCSATVSSNCALVSPAFTATAAAWRISGTSGPIMWRPTTRPVSPSQTIL